MWGDIKKFLSGFKGYQAAKNSNVVVLRCAMITQITNECVGTLGRVSDEEDKHAMIFKATKEKR
ncbi:hypothetical protein H5410_013069 [Solanum commersonii]|uniref:Uncharacterized protein n=1 Tax=Solanum commersonii TaxID=4109 RepID=A0A9J6AU94_SOLCO|nr:hypothetical protein H5410_013069 [Solanum commersonii]